MSEKKYEVALVGIDYTAPDPATYRAVVVVLIDGVAREVRRYETGDPLADWLTASQEVAPLVQTVAFSTTVDAFEVDGGVLFEPEQEEEARDLVYEIVHDTVMELLRRGELDLQCDCDSCLDSLISELYGEVSPYKRPLTI